MALSENERWSLMETAIEANDEEIFEKVQSLMPA
jgi:hypothetical protein